MSPVGPSPFDTLNPMRRTNQVGRPGTAPSAKARTASLRELAPGHRAFALVGAAKPGWQARRSIGKFLESSRRCVAPVDLSSAFQRKRIHRLINTLGPFAIGKIHESRRHDPKISTPSALGSLRIRSTQSLDQMACPGTAMRSGSPETYAGALSRRLACVLWGRITSGSRGRSKSASSQSSPLLTLRRKARVFQWPDCVRNDTAGVMAVLKSTWAAPRAARCNPSLQL
jgi:hypothetical protein